MEEQEEQQQEEKGKRPPIFTRSTLPIIVVFAVINVAVVLAIFWGSIFGGSAGGEDAEGQRRCVLEETSLISLGRIEVSMPLNPLQQNYIHCSASISLQVPADRQQELEPLITRNDAIFRELAREAFRNASPGDLATENLAGVKNSIKRGVNEVLGEEAVMQVYFKDYRPY